MEFFRNFHGQCSEYTGTDDHMTVYKPNGGSQYITIPLSISLSSAIKGIQRRGILLLCFSVGAAVLASCRQHGNNTDNVSWMFAWEGSSGVKAEYQFGKEDLDDINGDIDVNGYLGEYEHDDITPHTWEDLKEFVHKSGEFDVIDDEYVSTDIERKSSQLSGLNFVNNTEDVPVPRNSKHASGISSSSVRGNDGLLKSQHDVKNTALKGASTQNESQQGVLPDLNEKLNRLSFADAKELLSKTIRDDQVGLSFSARMAGRGALMLIKDPKSEGLRAFWAVLLQYAAYSLQSMGDYQTFKKLLSNKTMTIEREELLRMKEDGACRLAALREFLAEARTYLTPLCESDPVFKNSTAPVEMIESLVRIVVALEGRLEAVTDLLEIRVSKVNYTSEQIVEKEKAVGEYEMNYKESKEKVLAATKKCEKLKILPKIITVMTGL